MADRIRTTFYLPVTRSAERTAYLRTINHVNSLRPRDGALQPGVVIDGYTVSIDDPAIFGGMYWSSSTWIRDEIVLLIIDIPPAKYDQDAIRQLKLTIAAFYDQEGATQEVLYCTTKEIDLLQ
jgi:hypothetical protein